MKIRDLIGQYVYQQDVMIKTTTADNPSPSHPPSRRCCSHKAQASIGLKDPAQPMVKRKGRVSHSRHPSFPFPSHQISLPTRPPSLNNAPQIILNFTILFHTTDERTVAGPSLEIHVHIKAFHPRTSQSVESMMRDLRHS